MALHRIYAYGNNWFFVSWDGTYSFVSLPYMVGWRVFAWGPVWLRLGGR